MIRKNRQELHKRLEYISIMGPILNKKALYTDTSENYCRPQNISPGELLTIRFRTLRDNVDGVCIVMKNGKIPMQLVFTHDWFDYYEVKVVMPNRPLTYYFEIYFDKMTSK